MNSMFELATQEEIDALRTASATGETSQKDSEELELDDLEARFFLFSIGSFMT